MNFASNMRYCTAIQQIFVLSEIWQWEMKEWLKLHNLHIDHVMIQSEIILMIGPKVAETVKWNRSPD
jgi:hypothetical protein